MIREKSQASGAAVLKSAQTVLTVLGAFADLPYEASLAEIAQAVGIPKMKAHRALHTLVASGFLFQNPKTKKFRLHYSVLALARKFQSGQTVHTIAHDVLQGLALEVGEDITVAVMDQNQREVVFVDRLYGGSRISFFCDVGRRLPLHVGAAAKALLAYLPEEQFEDYLADFTPVEVSPHTIVSIEKVRQERRSILEKGYSFSNQEVDTGVSAVGACVLDADGHPAASMAIGTLHVNMTSRKIAEWGNLLKKTALEISANLGHGV
ncbi:MAG: IclR family transcriptional regulator [Proteobacteria bacterium]|nr:IclR family transcriptional regulator [Pseudomonadota bacterium]MBU4278685.1 IclR family transcriptional regulator [Pseudomonadota bacterium]MBU4385098.1 IclR family transcriptional regulator [Pseudomonadota bacterium]MBU4603299.1 IclR family transcriptional regulator [Pseudomonadota bacterium]MCG2763220.1 IclR family transcriptional regulator [Desulfarculaceae bacterium]